MTFDFNENLPDDDQYSKLVESYKEYIVDKFVNSGMGEYGIWEYNEKIMKEAVSRSISNTKPCSSKHKGCRDAILWLSLISHMEQTVDDLVFYLQ